MANESVSFKLFIGFMSEGQDNAEKALVQDVVGEFHGEEEDKSSTDYCGMFVQYGKHLPADYSCMDLTNSAGKQVHVSCASLCAAGAILPLAKHMTHFAAWVKDVRELPAASKALEAAPDALAKTIEGSRARAIYDKRNETDKLVKCILSGLSAADATEHGMARNFVVSCCSRTPLLFAKVVDMVKQDVTAMIAALRHVQGNMALRADFSKSLDQGELNAKLASSMCSDVATQKIFCFLHHGVDYFLGLKTVMEMMCAAVTNLESAGGFETSFTCLVSEAKGVIQMFAEFVRPAQSPEEVTLHAISSLIANATMAQAITRDLKTGETRTSLVNKALTGIKKRQWKLHPALNQRCTDILNGKVARPAAK